MGNSRFECLRMDAFDIVAVPTKLPERGDTPVLKTQNAKTDRTCQTSVRSAVILILVLVASCSPAESLNFSGLMISWQKVLKS